MSGDLQALLEVNERREANWKLPAVSLPPELLSNIFLECIDRAPIDPQYPHSSVVALRRTRTSLASVCHHWRQVTLETKYLWAVTSFPYHIINSTSDEGINSHTILPGTHDSFHHELEISGSIPLSLVLKIELHRPHHPSIPSQMLALERDIHTKLSPMFPRCKEIFVQAPSEAIISVLSASQQHLTNVKAICLRIWEHNSQDEGIVQILDLSHANINYIQDLCVDFLSQYAPPPLPTARLRLGDLSELKNLTILGCVDPWSAYEIVSRAFSLRSLIWRGKAALQSFSIPPRQILIPHLRHLVIDQIGPVSLLSHLDAPNVLSLTLAASCLRLEESPYPKSSQFSHLRFLGVESIVHTSPLLLIRLIPELRALEVLSLGGILTLGLSIACTQAPKLRLISATWIPVPSQWGGAEVLLECWTKRIHSQKSPFPSSSFGFCFLHHQFLPDSGQEMFTASFTMKYPDITVGLRQFHSFASWQPEDWDDFFATVDMNPSYLPPF